MPSPYYSFSSVRGVILDWDGVIAETKLDFTNIRKKYFGGRRVPLLEAAESMEPSVRLQYMQEIYDEEMRGAAASTEVEGIRALISLLDERGIRWCIHSRNCYDSVVLAANTISFELPEHTFSREASHVKPDPRAMYDAADAMGVPVSNCLVVGDYLYELIAARRGGIRCALVRHEDPECTALADAFFPHIDGLAKAIAEGELIVPWEYRQTVMLSGRALIEKMSSETVHIDAPLDRTAMTAIHKIASYGLGRITVPPKRRLTVSEILDNPALCITDLEKPLEDVFRKIFSSHYPLMRIETGTDGSPLSASLRK